MTNKIDALLIQHKWKISWSENFEELMPYSDINDTIFREDMFSSEKQIGENHYVIDIGAYGEHKRLKLYLIKNQNWEKPILVFKFSTFKNLYAKIIEILNLIESES